MAFKSSDPKTQLALTRNLEGVQPDEVRRAATRTLGTCTHLDLAIQETLVKQLGDLHLTQETVEALKAIRPTEDQLIERISKNLTSDSGIIRRSAVQVLGAIPKDSQVALAQVLYDPDKSVVREVLLALEANLNLSPAVQLKLTDLLTDFSDFPKENVYVLEPLISDLAVSVLKKVKKPDPLVLANLVQLLKRPKGPDTQDEDNQIKENQIKENQIKENQIKENRIKENRIKENALNILVTLAPDSPETNQAIELALQENHLPLQMTALAPILEQLELGHLDRQSPTATRAIALLENLKKGHPEGLREVIEILRRSDQAGRKQGRNLLKQLQHTFPQSDETKNLVNYLNTECEQPIQDVLKHKELSRLLYAIQIMKNTASH
jgi:hypothetical protein